MTKAQRYHEERRNNWMLVAWAQKNMMRDMDKYRHAVSQARHHNHQAIHVARLTRVREQARSAACTN